jgi:predicted dehydrogenase
MDVGFDAAIVNCISDVRSAAESGKHILIQAPMASTADDAAVLIDFFQRTKVKFALSGLPRNAPGSQTINTRLASGKLGNPGLLRVHRWRSQQDSSLASAIFGDIDLALNLFKSMPTEIYGIGRNGHGYYQVHFGFPGGGMALLDFAQQLPSGQTYDSLSLIGSKGAAYADDHHNTHLLFANNHPTALLSDCGTGFLFELREFVDYLARGISPTVTAQAIVAAHCVTDAVIRSIQSTEVLHQRGDKYESV